MVIPWEVVIAILSFVSGYATRGVVHYVVKIRREKERVHRNEEIRKQAIANGTFESRKLHPEMLPDELTD